MKLTLFVLAISAMVAVGAEPSKTTSKTMTTTTSSTLPTGSTGTSSAATTSASTTTVTTSDSLRSRIFGAIDVRPSIDMYWPKNSVRLENDVELGYKFTKDTSIMYEQDFYHTFSNPGVTGNFAAGNVMLRDGFFKLKVNNIVKSGALSLGYEGRYYLPTHEGKVGDGMVTEIRNYLKLGIQATPVLSFAFISAPFLHGYKRSVAPGGHATPVFSHRGYIVTELSLLQGRLNISLPIILDTIVFRPGGGARNSGRTGQFLWINPEVMYSVTPNLALGVSYYSNNLLQWSMPGDNVFDSSVDLSRPRIGHGLSKGVAQFAIRATL